MLFVFTGRSEQDSGLKQLYALSVKTPASGNLLLRGRTPVRPRCVLDVNARNSITCANSDNAAERNVHVQML